MNSIAPGSKRIFISDIHLGQPSSSKYPHPYCWLQKDKKHIEYLPNFLAEQLQAPDVGRIVILGDLFDRWVIPTDLDPLPGLKDICDDDANRQIIVNLQKLAVARKLSYIPGNHDMPYCLEEIAVVREFVEKQFSGIDFICEKNQPTGVYREGDLVAEHGNRYCLFNAPDVWTDPGKSFLPLGYFISRLVAYKVARTGLKENYADIFLKFLHESEHNHNFIYDIFMATAKNCFLDKNDPINLGNICGLGSPITVGQVAEKYAHLKENWDKDKPKIDSAIAMAGDTPTGLLDVAYKVYLGPGTDENITIAIFGHTHTWENESTDPHDECADDPSQPCKAIYANSGARVDSVDFCTYVETEVDEESQRHYVRVKTYPGPQVSKVLFVDL